MLNDISSYFQVALRIRPMKNEEKARGCKSVADKVDDKVSGFFLLSLIFNISLQNAVEILSQIENCASSLH